MSQIFSGHKYDVPDLFYMNSALAWYSVLSYYLRALLFWDIIFMSQKLGTLCHIARQFSVQSPYIRYIHTGRSGTSFLCPRFNWDIKMMYQICSPRALCWRGIQFYPTTSRVAIGNRIYEYHIPFALAR